MADVKLHNGGALGLVRVEMCQAFQTLRCNNVAMARSLLSCCSRFLLLKDLRRNLDYHLLGEKYVNKIFLLFSGSESAEVSSN